MRFERTENRLPKLVLLSVSVIVLFLCMTWAPVYGYNVARVGNLTGNGSNTGGATGDAPALTSEFGQGFYSDTPASPDNPHLVYDQRGGANDAQCPEPVPEPTTLVLMGLGIAGGALYRKVRG